MPSENTRFSDGMKRTMVVKLILATILIGVGSVASAGVEQHKFKNVPCIIFKNGKLVKSLKCSGAGYTYANMHGGGHGADFFTKGFGKVKVSFVYDEDNDKTFVTL